MNARSSDNLRRSLSYVQSVGSCQAERRYAYLRYAYLMADDQDYLVLVRETLLRITDLQAEIGTLRLAVQRHGISLEELALCRAELERRLPLEAFRLQVQALGLADLLQVLKDHKSTIQ